MESRERHAYLGVRLEPAVRRDEYQVRRLKRVFRGKYDSTHIHAASVIIVIEIVQHEQPFEDVAFLRLGYDVLYWVIAEPPILACQSLYRHVAHAEYCKVYLNGGLGFGVWG